MGPEASLVHVNAIDKYMDLSGRGMKNFKVKIPFDAKTQILNLNRNQLRELPMGVYQLRHVSLQHNNLTTIPDKMISALKTYPMIEKIDFSFNQIASIPKELFTIKTIKHVNFFGNKISELEFQSESVVLLTLGLNEFRVQPKLPHSIAYLSLDYNKLTEFSLELPHLQRLSLNHNLITALNTKNIIYKECYCLDLSHNKIKEISNLPQLFPRLKQLDISYNDIEEFPPLPRSISEFKAKSNKIKTLPTFIKFYTCLCKMNLDNNEIEYIPVLPSSLQTLNLVNNKIKHIDPNSIQDLAHLYLMNNELDSIPDIKSQQLSDYFLTYNKISNIDIRFLSQNVRVLDLSYNSISSLPDELFKLPIYSLILQSNQIKDINTNIENCSTLTVLNLSSNPLVSLPICLPESIEELNISNCWFSSLNEGVFNRLPNLFVLDCSCNRISEFPQFSNESMLMTLFLFKNNFVTFPKLPHNLEKLDISYNSIAELSQNVSLPSLKVLDISFNILTIIPDISQSFPSLERINFNNNPIKTELNLSMNILKYLDISGTKLQLSSQNLSYLNDLKLREKESKSKMSQLIQQRQQTQQMQGDNLLHPFNLSTSKDILALHEYNHQKIVFISHNSQKAIYQTNIKPGILYTSVPGQNRTNSDILTIKTDTRPGTHCFGITDRSTSSRRASKFASLFLSNIQEQGQFFSKDHLLTIYNQASNAVENEHIPFSFLSIKNDYICACSLNMPIFVIYHHKISQIAGNHQCFFSFTTKNANYCHIGDDHDFSESVIYKKPMKPIIEQCHISDDMRYILLVNRSVIDSLTHLNLLSVCTENETPEAILNEIKARTFGASCNDNISIILIDIRKVLK